MAGEAGGAKASWGADAAILAGLLALTFLAYRGSLHNGFMTDWDDNKYILWNDMIKVFSAEGIKALFTAPYFANYHPLTMLSYAVEYNLFGLSPGAFHATNLLLHLFNTALAFIFAKLLWDRTDIAGIVSGIFALHPMHVESVAWISERKDVLYGFFFLAALVTYVLYARRGYRVWLLAAAFLLFSCSILSKSAAAPLPVVLLLVDYFLGRPLLSWRTILEKVPFFLVAIAFGLIAVVTQREFGATSMAPAFPAYEKLFLASYALVFYPVKFLLPVNLCAVYYYPEPAGALPVAYYLAPLLVILAAWGIFKSGAHRKHLIFGSLFYLSTIFMVIQIIPLGRSVTSDRYSYIPFIGLAYIVGHLFCTLADGGRVPRWALNSALIFTALFLAVMTHGRCRVWASGMELFTDAIKKNPGHHHCWAARGYAKMEKKDYAGSVEDYTEAIRLKDEDPVVRNNHGTALMKLERYQEAIADFDRCIQMDPKFAMAYYNKAQSIDKLNKDYAGAIALYTKAVELDPKYALAFSSRGLAKFQLNDLDGAVADCDRAIAIDPKLADAHHNRGTANARAGRYAEAVADFDRALALNPEWALAYSNRAVAKFHLGDKAGACADWQIAASKGSPEAQRFLAEQCR